MIRSDDLTVTTPESWITGLLGLEKLEVTDRTLTLLLTDTDNARRALAWRKAKLLGDARMLDVVRTHLWNKFNAAIAGLLEATPGDADAWGALLEHAMDVAAATCRFDGALLRLPAAVEGIDLDRIGT